MFGCCNVPVFGEQIPGHSPIIIEFVDIRLLSHCLGLEMKLNVLTSMNQDRTPCERLNINTARLRM